MPSIQGKASVSTFNPKSDSMGRGPAAGRSRQLDLGRHIRSLAWARTFQMTTTVSRVASRPINFARSAPRFRSPFGTRADRVLANLPVATLDRQEANNHLHAITATLWMLMLVAQPLAIRTKRLTLHRRLGRTSYALAPVVLMSMVLLAHSKTHGVSVTQNVEIYVPLSLAALFALFVDARHPHATDARAARALHGVHRAHTDRSRTPGPDDVLGVSEPDMEGSMVHLRCDGPCICRVHLAGAACQERPCCIPRDARGVRRYAGDSAVRVLSRVMVAGIR